MTRNNDWDEEMFICTGCGNKSNILSVRETGRYCSLCLAKGLYKLETIQQNRHIIKEFFNHTVEVRVKEPVFILLPGIVRAYSYFNSIVNAMKDSKLESRNINFSLDNSLIVYDLVLLEQLSRTDN